MYMNMGLIELWFYELFTAKSTHYDDDDAGLGLIVVNSLKSFASKDTSIWFSIVTAIMIKSQVCMKMEQSEHIRVSEPVSLPGHFFLGRLSPLSC